MAIEIMTKVWKEAPYYGNTLLCLLACADWANDEGEFYPSYSTIGKKIRITRRSAIRILASLVEEGAVSKVIRGDAAHHKSNLFKIHTEKFAELGDRNVIAKPKRAKGYKVEKTKKLVTPETLPSDTESTGASDSQVTHIHHVESLDYPPCLVENHKADSLLDETVQVIPTGTEEQVSLTVHANGGYATPPEVAQSTPLAKPLTDHQRMMDALSKVHGGRKILNGKTQGAAIKRILTGYTADQAIECLEWMADPQSWWKGNIDWLSVQKQILSYLTRKEQQQTKLGGNNGKSKFDFFDICNSQPFARY